MPILAKLREFLEANRIPYSIHSHPEAYRAQEIAALQHVKGRSLAKVVIVRADANFLMLVLPADLRVDFIKLKTALGCEVVRLAHEAEFKDLFPGCEVGSMPPFGNLYGLLVYVDASLKGADQIVFNAGTHTLTVKMAFRDFESLAKPMVTDFAAQWPAAYGSGGAS